MTDHITTALQKFNRASAEIAKMQQDFMPLTITGIDDRSGYKQVKDARLTVKSARVGIEKIRKELKEDSLSYGRAVDAEARRITALLLPIENHLQAQEKAVDDEKERIKREAEERRLAKLQTRIDAIRAVSTEFNYASIANMSDSEFEAALASATETYHREQERLVALAEEERIMAEEARKAEEEVRRQERENLAVIAEEQRRRRDELEAKEREIEAERARLAEQERRLKEAEETKINEAAKVKLPELKIIDPIPEKKIEEAAFPCEREKSGQTTISEATFTSIPTKDWKIILEFVKGLSRHDENISHLFAKAQFTSERSNGNYDDVFDDGIESALACVAIEAREVLKQIGEDYEGGGCSLLFGRPPTGDQENECV